MKYYSILWNTFFLCSNAVKKCMYKYRINLYTVELVYDVIEGTEQIVSS